MRTKRTEGMVSVEVENKTVEAFIASVVNLERRFGLAISHEDDHGAFVIEKLNDGLVEWFEDANIGETVPADYQKEF